MSVNPVRASGALLPDLDALQSEPWWRAMTTCPQDPVHHPEGDVGVHTRMVHDALLTDPDWHALDGSARAVLAWAALLHDVGKPATTREENGRITSRGHSRVGEILARRLLWETGVPFALRERICALVRTHMRPHFLLEKENPEREMIWLSHLAELPLLATLARADARGRGADPANALARIDLFAEYATELGVWSGPWAFASDVARYEYFRRPDRSPHYAGFDETWGEVIVMCGLPGAGKDTWVAENAPDLPVISLDDMRSEAGLKASETTGALIAAARERAREYLRKRQPFVWNATNISREIRSRITDLVGDYHARVRIVYVEATPERREAQNAARERVVPAAAMERMLHRWEIPNETEAHRLDVVLLG